MTTRALWILGAGGHGVVVADAARAGGRWASIAFFDDRWPDLGPVGEWPLVGDSAGLFGRVADGAAASADVVVAVGDNARRLELCRSLLAGGATLATVIHPFTALSPSALIGAGSVVLAGAVLNARARVGLAGIINTRASVDHDCSLGDAVHLCPGVALAGNVTVKERAWLGIGSSVIQGVTIGEDALVGAGSAVIRNVRPHTTVAGCPAKEIQRVV